MNRYAVFCYDQDQDELGAIGLRASSVKDAKDLAFLYVDFVRVAWALTPAELRTMADNLERIEEHLLPSTEQELEDVSEYGVPDLLEPLRPAITDRECYTWAIQQQGYRGTFNEWKQLPAAERQQYEDGAAGKPTA